jgi:hypothetical protein
LVQRLSLLHCLFRWLPLPKTPLQHLTCKPVINWLVTTLKASVAKASAVTRKAKAAVVRKAVKAHAAPMTKKVKVQVVKASAVVMLNRQEPTYET